MIDENDIERLSEAADAYKEKFGYFPAWAWNA